MSSHSPRADSDLAGMGSGQVEEEAGPKETWSLPSSGIRSSTRMSSGRRAAVVLPGRDGLRLGDREGGLVGMGSDQPKANLAHLRARQAALALVGPLRARVMGSAVATKSRAACFIFFNAGREKKRFLNHFCLSHFFF